MFQLGDKVVYAGHGVAEVNEVVEKVVGDKTIKFFKLKFIYKGMTILVPMHEVARGSSVRPLSSDVNIERAMSALHETPKRLESNDFTPSSWNRRNKDYQMKLQSGNLIDIASIYRDLMFISQQKDLSFGEKNLLHVAEDLLVQEIVTVKQEDKETTTRNLRRVFGNFSFVARSMASAAVVQQQAI